MNDGVCHKAGGAGKIPQPQDQGKGDERKIMESGRTELTTRGSHLFSLISAGKIGGIELINPDGITASVDKNR
ncbi:hypothetical protein EWD94_25070 [Salmonella enterica subsp. enterica serovar Newport]|nr:hypothetical protein [Salmonella enterica subsp. enterica serovar Newport]